MSANLEGLSRASPEELLAVVRRGANAQEAFRLALALCLLVGASQSHERAMAELAKIAVPDDRRAGVRTLLRQTIAQCEAALERIELTPRHCTECGCPLERDQPADCSVCWPCTDQVI